MTYRQSKLIFKINTRFVHKRDRDERIFEIPEIRRILGNFLSRKARETETETETERHTCTVKYEERSREQRLLLDCGKGIWFCFLVFVVVVVLLLLLEFRGQQTRAGTTFVFFFSDLFSGREE